MTRQEFDALMLADGWSTVQRERWKNMTPLCGADAFRTEMSRPDGVIEYRYEDTRTLCRVVWKRLFMRHDAQMLSENDLVKGSN